MKLDHFYFKEKNFIFDFFYLFIALILFNLLFLSVTYILFNNSFFESKDLEYLSAEKVLFYVIFYPLIEEFAFRGVFFLNNRIFIFSSLICIIIIAISIFKNIHSIYPFIAIVLLFYFFMFFNNHFNKEVTCFINNHRISFLILTSIAFGVLHITNYDNITIQSFFKIFPRIVGGFYLGYIAIKYGFFYAYLMHSLNNILPFLILLVQLYFYK